MIHYIAAESKYAAWLDVAKNDGLCCLKGEDNRMLFLSKKTNMVPSAWQRDAFMTDAHQVAADAEMPRLVTACGNCMKLHLKKKRRPKYTAEVSAKMWSLFVNSLSFCLFAHSADIGVAKKESCFSHCLPLGFSWRIFLCEG